MASLTIRGLDDETHARLRVRAAHNGRSMEAEVRAILRESLGPTSSGSGLGTRIHELFAAFDRAELELPKRVELSRAAEFDE